MFAPQEAIEKRRKENPDLKFDGGKKEHIKETYNAS